LLIFEVEELGRVVYSAHAFSFSFINHQSSIINHQSPITNQHTTTAWDAHAT
jgi:hypothetical protein